MVIFSSSARLLGNRLPKITDSGLYFAINQPETYFLCGFMMKRTLHATFMQPFMEELSDG